MRSVPEWVGRHDDEAIPPRVKLRLFERANGTCANCTRKIMIGEPWQCDHMTALCNGGKHAEGNLQVLCPNCHGKKTKVDVAQKAETYAARMAHLGFRPTNKRPMPHGKNSATKRKVTGEVVRRCP